MRTTTVLVGALVAAAATLAPVGAGAAPAPLRCGDSITTDVRLTRDLVCTGDALRVDAPGVRIDLDGHRLRGTGSGVGVTVSFAPDPAASVRVLDGRIEGFAVGVRTSSPTSLESLVLAGNAHGVENRGGAMTLTASTVRDSDFGIIHGAPTTLVRSEVRGNGTGVTCSDTSLVVRRSTFTGNDRGIGASVCGLTVESSTFRGGEVGIDAAPQGFDLDVRGSSFRDAGIGLRVTRAPLGRRVVSGNEFRGNAASGLVIDTDDQVGGFDVSGNVLRGNGFAPGDRVSSTGASLTAGLWASAGTLRRNDAVANAGRGIEAYSVTDGGRNTARANRLQPQCVGVVCTPARRVR